MKEQLEQKKANDASDKVGIENLMSQVSLEEEKLEKLKQILDAANKEANKYNLIRKIFGEQMDSIRSQAKKNMDKAIDAVIDRFFFPVLLFSR